MSLQWDCSHSFHFISFSITCCSNENNKTEQKSVFWVFRFILWLLWALNSCSVWWIYNKIFGFMRKVLSFSLKKKLLLIFMPNNYLFGPKLRSWFVNWFIHLNTIHKNNLSLFLSVCQKIKPHHQQPTTTEQPVTSSSFASVIIHCYNICYKRYDLSATVCWLYSSSGTEKGGTRGKKRIAQSKFYCLFAAKKPCLNHRDYKCRCTKWMVVY